MWSQRLLGMGYMLTGAGVLVGWIGRVPELVIHGPASMMPATALGIAVLGARMVLPDARGRVAMALLLLGASVMAAYALEVGHPLDTWPIEPWTAWGTPIPGRMSPSTAASFVLVGALKFLPAARNAVCTLGLLAALPTLLAALFPFHAPQGPNLATAMSPVTGMVFGSFWLWALWRLSR